jgi:tetratricopeptide (TPR) repeat protein
MKTLLFLTSVVLLIVGCNTTPVAAQPSFSAPSLASAKTLLAERNYTEAAQMLALLAKRDSMNALVFRYLGDAQLGLDNAEAAIPAFERAVRLDSNAQYPILSLAKIFRDRSLFVESRSLFLRALRLDASNQGIFTGIAQTYFEQERFDSALVWYNRVEKPTASIYLQKARCYAELGESVRAGDAYSSAATLAPTNAALLLERIDFWMKQGQSNEAAYNIAEQYAKEGIVQFQTDTRFSRRRADALLLLRRPEAAYNALYLCIVQGDSTADVWRDMGIAWYLRKQHGLADSLLDIAEGKYAAKGELDSRLLYFRGLTKRELGANDEAVRFFRAAMFAGGKGRQVADIHTQIGLSYRKAGHLDYARNAYGHALATDSSRAEPYYELAMLMDDANMKFTSEAARTKHREIVAPLYFKFLERSMNKSLKSVEFALMRLYTLGTPREVVEAHCGWLKSKITLEIPSATTITSTNGSLLRLTDSSQSSSSGTIQHQDSLARWYGHDAEGNPIAPPDTPLRGTSKTTTAKDTASKLRKER